MLMLQFKDVVLRPAKRSEKDFLWRAIYLDQEWKQYDAPYHEMAYQSKFRFGRKLFKRLQEGETARVIEFKGQTVGYLTSYWEDPLTQWLEVGITIFHRQYWNKKIGRKALSLWISHLFNTTNIPRVGLSTWSGNPRMMKCAMMLGMKLEARFRKVRFYNQQYYDSVHFGVLREEWQALQAPQALPSVSEV